MHFTVNDKIADNRIDIALKTHLNEAGFVLSRSNIQRMISSGRVEVNGISCIQKKYRLALNDSVYIPDDMLHDDKCSRSSGDMVVRPENLPIDIVYEDEYLLICDKPRGMPVYPPRPGVSGTLANALLFHYGELSDFAGADRPGIVHRLDSDTGGLIVIARDNATHKKLSEAFSGKAVQRAYRAVVFGSLNLDIGEEKLVDAPIARNPADRLKRIVSYDAPDAREAQTKLKLLGDYGAYSYVECELVTGRTHQIRVHMAYLNHPVVGDRLYAGGFAPALTRSGKRINVPGLLLHSHKIAFEHPHTGEFMEFVRGEPEDFCRVLSSIMQ